MSLKSFVNSIHEASREPKLSIDAQRQQGFALTEPARLSHLTQALKAIVARELFKFSRQYGRLASALVRPLLWLAVFAAGFRSVFGVAIIEPYDT